MWPHLENFILTKVKLFIRYFLSIRSFAKKLSSGSFGSYLLGIKFFLIFFLADFRMSVGLLEFFDLLSLIYNSVLV